MFCTKCGNRNPEGAIFCEKCGEQLSQGGAQPGPEMSAGQPPQPPMGPPGMGAPFPPGGPGMPGPGMPGSGIPGAMYSQVPTHLVWAIITTVLCCWPAGIVSIVYAAQVNGKLAAGDYQGALQSSNNARTWAIVSVVAWLVVMIFLIILGAIGEMAGPY